MLASYAADVQTVAEHHCDVSDGRDDAINPVTVSQDHVGRNPVQRCNSDAILFCFLLLFDLRFFHTGLTTTNKSVAAETFRRLLKSAAACIQTVVAIHEQEGGIWHSGFLLVAPTRCLLLSKKKKKYGLLSSHEIP